MTSEDPKIAGQSRSSTECSVQKILEELTALRLRAEENEQKFRALFENALDGIMLLDCRTRRFLMPNQQMCRMLGCTPEEIEQMTLLDILPPDVHQAALEHFEQLAAGHPQQISAQSIRRKDGQIFYADISAALFWLNGAPYAVGIFRDVTEKQRRQQEQLRQQQELDAVFQAVPVGISHVRNRIFIRVNKIFCSLLGYSPEELIGRDTSCLYRSREEFVFWGQSLYSRLETQGEVMDELTFQHKDGHLLSVLLRGVYLDPQDRSKGELFALTDITGRKRTERELRAKNEELESIVFVASHDLRGPLVNIEGFSGEIQRAAEELKNILKTSDIPKETAERILQILDRDIAESLHFISAGTAKMDSLLSGLLRLSRVGTAPIRIEPIRMNALVQLILGSMRYEIRRLGAQIYLESLPDCLGDAVQVNQVFSNLLDNALKYRRPDTPPEIWLSGQTNGNEVIYTVRDNGIGIDREHHEKIFEIFHRLYPDGPQKGEGLGLTIVRRILDRLDGRIWVESEPGAGASFFVVLPAVR
ncbi:MAG: PAS domain S-box protein [Anaerohalosphaeraceae bacterium]